MAGPSFTIRQLKEMITLLDEAGLELLSKTLTEEKDFYRFRELKSIFMQMNDRIVWLKNNRDHWTIGLCLN